MSPQLPSSVPRTTGQPGGSAIRITNPSGAPIQLPSTTNRPSFAEKTENRRSVIRIESPANKLQREEEEREKKREGDEAKKAVEDARKKKEAEEKAHKDEEVDGSNPFRPSSALTRHHRLGQQVEEKDGRSLIQVIGLVFEKATDEAVWSEMYAGLCRKMMEQTLPAVMDEGIRNAEGQPIISAKTAAAAAEKAQDDEAKKSNEPAQGGEEVSFSDEYHAAQKSKHRGLGLVRFISELFKLQMLTEHECIKKLLSNVDSPGEEEIESIYKLPRLSASRSTCRRPARTWTSTSSVCAIFRRAGTLTPV
ncbi:hypothetical protein EXIGLDRAFT_844654 [Exidia glandulosa HHB12029]|uniref:MIF4G domain-containing protein n=1 Tax=Exidia glandulosa HHB12029 TaxID=1314781 RepID=A0A165BWM6_EXIGL|nr:hypothetical protein EXIGLDRAFT_844654 [Exidia glandulosa HHB12029]